MEFPILGAYGVAILQIAAYIDVCAVEAVSGSALPRFIVDAQIKLEIVEGKPDTEVFGHRIRQTSRRVDNLAVIFVDTGR